MQTRWQAAEKVGQKISYNTGTRHIKSEVQTSIKARVIDTTWGKKRKRAYKRQTTIPLMALYNIVWIQWITMMKRILKCKSGTLSQCVCIKILTMNNNNDQKKHKAETIEGRAQNKASEATKLIPRPETIMISTKMLKQKRLNKMCLG